MTHESLKKNESRKTCRHHGLLSKQEHRYKQKKKAGWTGRARHYATDYSYSYDGGDGCHDGGGGGGDESGGGGGECGGRECGREDSS